MDLKNQGSCIINRKKKRRKKNNNILCVSPAMGKVGKG